MSGGKPKWSNQLPGQDTFSGLQLGKFHGVT